MDPLVRGALLLRGAFRRGHGLVLALAIGAFVACGGATTGDGVGQAAALIVWTFLLYSRLRVRLRVTGEAPFLVDVKADTTYKNVLFGVYQRQCTQITARIPGGAPAPAVAGGATP